MEKLKTIKSLPFEIAQLLGDDVELQQLLVDDNNNLSNNFEKWNLSDLLEKEYISFAPVVDNNIKNNTRNTFLIINLEEIDFVSRDDNMVVSGAIFIGTDKQHSMLSGSRLRLVEMISQIYDLLNNYKFSAAGTVNMEYATFVNFSEYVFGYKIVFKVVEQEIRKAEI